MAYLPNMGAKHMDYNVSNVERRMAWDILYTLFWMCIGLLIVGIYIYTRPRLEGFSNMEGNTKIQACHGILKSLRANKGILAEYEQKNAVNSMEHTKELIEHFTNASNTFGCDAISATHPIPDVLIPNRDDVMKASILKIQEKFGVSTSE